MTSIWPLQVWSKLMGFSQVAKPRLQNEKVSSHAHTSLGTTNCETTNLSLHFSKRPPSQCQTLRSRTESTEPVPLVATSCWSELLWNRPWHQITGFCLERILAVTLSPLSCFISLFLCFFLPFFLPEANASCREQRGVCMNELIRSQTEREIPCVRQLDRAHSGREHLK